eukprot:SM000307S11703  [mRNA]  locus=s307:12827:18752:- [translate_table: standard]
MADGVARLDCVSYLVKKDDNTWGPYFESVNSWGIQRTVTKLLCGKCQHQVGTICFDGPALNGGHGQLGFGTSQVLHRYSRYRIKLKAVTPIYRHGDMALGIPLYSFDGLGLENGDDKPAGMGRLPFWSSDTEACLLDGFFLSSFSDGTSPSSFEDTIGAPAPAGTPAIPSSSKERKSAAPSRASGSAESMMSAAAPTTAACSPVTRTRVTASSLGSRSTSSEPKPLVAAASRPSSARRGSRLS